jgi:zinc-binding in reverse transcriptase
MYDAAITYSTDGNPQTRWSETFSVRPIYKQYNNPGIIEKEFLHVWTLKAPNKIKVFLWLLLHDRLNIADNLLNNKID